MKKLNLYFAHNFNNRREYRKLEKQLEKELGINLFNPFYDNSKRVQEMKEFDRERGSVYKRIKDRRMKLNYERCRQIVLNDLSALLMQN